MPDEKRLRDLRGTIDFLREAGELFTVGAEVDPIYEVAGIVKEMDGGPAILFEKIKGYPAARTVANVFSRREAIAALLDLPGPQEIMKRCHQALMRPVRSESVRKAPCQEVVLSQQMDLFSVLPMIKHTEEDAGRILGGAHVLIMGEYFAGGSELAFKRMHFQGEHWASLMAGDPTHTAMIARKYRGQRIPMTVNIGAPPAVTLVAGGGALHAVVPFGSDELAIAGGLQGFPVELCRARTVDAHAMARAEWVIEGYLDLTKTVWESPQAEAEGGWRKAPFFPEHGGYMGRAVKTLCFEATAITHRKDAPIFYAPLAHSIEANNLCACFREATMYELAERMMPGFVTDVRVLDAQKGQLGAVLQVRKKSRRQEGLQQNVLRAILSMPEGPQVAIAVDEDIHIHSAEDIIWALTTRVNPSTGIITTGGELKRRGSPMEELVEAAGLQGAIGIDATIPFDKKEAFKTGRYPVHRIDLRKLFSEEDIHRMRSLQSDYGKLQARRGT